MKYIPMRILEYRLDENGVIQTIVVAHEQREGQQSFNGRILLDEEYVKSINPNVELDRMNQAQVENFARRKLIAWINTPRPEETEEENEEETTEETEAE